jgi:hypothetical protein
MYRKKPEQLQFFPEDKDLKEEYKISNLMSILYERRIWSLIIFTICLLITYSLGVEKGKREILVKKEIEMNKVESITPKTKKIQPSPERKEIQEIKGYIIQVATYKKISGAEKEASNLKKKGFPAFTRSSGNFVVVYVGSFQNREEAVISLKRLKKYYSDCFIRQL